MTPTAPATPLPAATWRARAAEHRARASRWTGPALRRHSSGRRHPVEDFLFTYYPFSLAKLEQWHPPFGVALEIDAPLPPHLEKPPYHRQGHTLSSDPAQLSEKERARLRWIRELLRATRDRAPNLACHGLHEWAMVYRGSQVRHATVTPLRLPQGEIDALVESRPIRCSHFDAFRFFHPEAQPMNRLQPALDTRTDHEQPACIHANMDLYKWAFKSMPWVGSDLLLDAFELAMQLRDLDMRASPYDLAEYGLDPVKIETPDGRRAYEQEQARLAALAAPLRERIITSLDGVL